MNQTAQIATEDSDTFPDPAGIMQVATSYWASQTLFTANRIGLFERLSRGPQGAGELAASLDADPRTTALLLDACAALGLVERPDGRYRNSPTSEAFLVPGRPGYLGDAIRYSDDLYRAWGDLERTVRNGEPAAPPASYLGEDANKTRNFVHGMHNRALGIAAALVDLVDLGARRRMLDVGGGPGTYSALFTGRYPGLTSTVLDLPAVVSLARDILDSMGAAERVATLAGDYHRSAFPAGNDVVLISGVFHRETAANCQRLIAKASNSLDAGGLLVVSDVFAGAGGLGPAFAALFGLNMAVSAPDGGVHAAAEVGQWMRDAGLVDIRIRSFPRPLPHAAIVAAKA